MSAAAGPRPLTSIELDAVTMYFERTPVEVITARTGLSAPRIAAAVDETRAMAKASAARMRQPAVPAPAPPPAPVVRRAARPARVAGAIAPAMPWPATYAASSGELTDRPKTVPPVPDVLPAPAAPQQPRPASTSHATAPAPGSRVWTRLATSDDVRDWAARDGWMLPPPGVRLPGAIVLAYHQAHGGTP